MSEDLESIEGKHLPRGIYTLLSETYKDNIPWQGFCLLLIPLRQGHSLLSQLNMPRYHPLSRYDLLEQRRVPPKELSNLLDRHRQHLPGGQ
jgi:hypothetical protein